mmetsp:Transcript_19475/g.60127  ORF Transcript_19475/g.60127 Transcript_19475/m.60127 type:complete len:363 (+) Transcript_19475:197-1285(+)
MLLSFARDLVEDFVFSFWWCCACDERRQVFRVDGEGSLCKVRVRQRRIAARHRRQLNVPRPARKRCRPIPVRWPRSLVDWESRHHWHVLEQPVCWHQWRRRRCRRRRRRRQRRRRSVRLFGLPTRRVGLPRSRLRLFGLPRSLRRRGSSGRSLLGGAFAAFLSRVFIAHASTRWFGRLLPLSARRLLRWLAVVGGDERGNDFLRRAVLLRLLRHFGRERWQGHVRGAPRVTAVGRHRLIEEALGGRCLDRRRDRVLLSLPPHRFLRLRDLGRHLLPETDGGELLLPQRSLQLRDSARQASHLLLETDHGEMPSLRRGRLFHHLSPESDEIETPLLQRSLQHLQRVLHLVVHHCVCARRGWRR